MAKIVVLCGYCRKPFPLTPSEYRNRLMRNAGGKMYCESECFHNHKRQLSSQRKRFNSALTSDGVVSLLGSDGSVNRPLKGLGSYSNISERRNMMAEDLGTMIAKAVQDAMVNAGVVPAPATPTLAPTAPPVANTGFTFNPTPSGNAGVSSSNSELLQFDDVRAEANCRASIRPVTMPAGLSPQQVYWKQYEATGDKQDRLGKYTIVPLGDRINQLPSCMEIGGEHHYMVIVKPGNQEAGRYTPLPANNINGGNGNPCFSCNSFLSDGSRENKGYMTMRNLKNCHNYDTDPVRGHGCTVDGVIRDYSIIMPDGSRQAPSPDFNTYVQQIKAQCPATPEQIQKGELRMQQIPVASTPTVQTTGIITQPLDLSGATPQEQDPYDNTTDVNLEDLPF